MLKWGEANDTTVTGRAVSSTTANKNLRYFVNRIEIESEKSFEPHIVHYKKKVPNLAQLERQYKFISSLFEISHRGRPIRGPKDYNITHKSREGNGKQVPQVAFIHEDPGAQEVLSHSRYLPRALWQIRTRVSHIRRGSKHDYDKGYLVSVFLYTTQ